MKRRLLCLSLCLCLLCSVLVFPASAAHVCTDADSDYWCDDCWEVMPHFCCSSDGDAWCDFCWEDMKHTCYYYEDSIYCEKCWECQEHDCVDTDGNYRCDLCWEVPEHECQDNDNDYACDLCRFTIDHDCLDSDGDYLCDLCEWPMEHECIDTDGDYLCDVCWYAVEHECIDRDYDDWCDICDDWMGVYSSYPTISGTVKSGLDNLEPVHVDIMLGDEWLWLANFAILTGIPANYELETFAEENESFSVVVSKENHVTRTYNLVMGTDPIDLDLTICPIGDVSGDCKLTVGDTAKLYAHIRSTNPITEDYTLQCANVNGGKLNMGDVAALYAHIKGTSTLW